MKTLKNIHEGFFSNVGATGALYKNKVIEYLKNINTARNKYQNTIYISPIIINDALKEINERVPDVVITTQDFQIKVSKIILAYSKPKVYVTETGMYISPSSESLTEVLLKEVNSKLEYWEKRKQTIIEAYNNTINMKHTDERNLKSFYYENKEVSWNELPLDVRKHDYPYYFDENGVDHYPMIMIK